MGLLRVLWNPLEYTCPCLYKGRNSLPCLTISTYSLCRERGGRKGGGRRNPPLSFGREKPL